MGIVWDFTLPDTLNEKIRKWCYKIEDLLTFEIHGKYFVNIAKLNPEAVHLLIYSDVNLTGYGLVAYIHDLHDLHCESVRMFCEVSLL